MTDSQQSSGSAHSGKASSKARPAKVAPATGTPPNAPISGGPFRHGSQAPPLKWETPQSELPPQADDVTTSAQSANLGERYEPGSAPGGPAPTIPVPLRR